MKNWKLDIIGYCVKILNLYLRWHILRHANMLDFSKNATTKCHDDHIILGFYGTTERLMCWEFGGSYITGLKI